MNIGAGGGALGQQGAPPCYSSLWETLLSDTLTMLIGINFGRMYFHDQSPRKYGTWPGSNSWALDLKTLYRLRYAARQPAHVIMV